MSVYKTPQRHSRPNGFDQTVSSLPDWVVSGRTDQEISQEIWNRLSLQEQTYLLSIAEQETGDEEGRSSSRREQ